MSWQRVLKVAFSYFSVGFTLYVLYHWAFSPNASIGFGIIAGLCVSLSALVKEFFDPPIYEDISEPMNG